MCHKYLGSTVQSDRGFKNKAGDICALSIKEVKKVSSVMRDRGVNKDERLHKCSQEEINGCNRRGLLSLSV